MRIIITNNKIASTTLIQRKNFFVIYFSWLSKLKFINLHTLMGPVIDVGSTITAVSVSQQYGTASLWLCRKKIKLPLFILSHFAQKSSTFHCCVKIDSFFIYGLLFVGRNQRIFIRRNV